MRVLLPLCTLAETPSPRMFWVSFATPPYLVTIHATVYKYPTVSVRTGCIIRISSLLARALDHRHSQVESGFRTDNHPRIDLQRDERYRVHLRVSIARNETFLPCLFINSLETPTGIGMRRRSGPAVWGGTWDSAVLGVSCSRERSRTAWEGYLGPDNHHRALPASRSLWCLPTSQRYMFIYFFSGQ